MDVLQVTLLGSVRVTHNNWLSEAKLTREIQALLAFLLLQRHRPHPREVLTDLFWADHSQEKARRALNTALWRLRKALEPEGILSGTYLVTAHSGEVGFNRESEYWLDVEVFEKGITHLITYPSQTWDEPKVQNLERIIELYKGELLEGLYDDWAVRERERLRGLYLISLAYLMQYYKFHKDYERARAYGQQILNLDPIREDIHREMMRIYLENGRRALAARQYTICQLTLIKELGISPMEETQMLYTQIFAETPKKHEPSNSEDPYNVPQVLGQLQQVSQTIDLAKEQVQQAIYTITNHISSEEDKISAEVSNKRKANKIRIQRMERRIE